MAAIATTYIVQPGDTLSGIARRLGIGWVELAEANRDQIGNYNLSRSFDGSYNVIRAGQVLRVPGGTAPQSIDWTTAAVQPSVRPDPGTGAILPPEIPSWVWLAGGAALLYFLTR